MGKPHHSPSLPIDFDQVTKIFPALETAASDLEYILQGYQDVDRLYKRHFLGLFTGPDNLTPPDDRAWSALINLRDLAQSDNLISTPLHRLEFNNDRAGLVCSLLSIIFKL